MTALARLAAVQLVRAPARTAIRTLTLAAAVALLAAMLLFVGHSLRTMTGGAVRSVPLDWQGPVVSYGAARRVAAEVGRRPGVLEASPVATAPFAGAEHRADVGTIRSGAGSILAVPLGYAAHLRTLRFLRGSLRPGQIVLDQQLAATLQAQPGDTLLVRARPNARPHRFRVGGVALVTAADVLFQPLDPLLGPAPAQPPADIAILPLRTFARTLAPSLRSITPASPGTAAVPGAQTGVQWQVQAQIDPKALAGSPAHALKRATQIRNAVERTLPGQVQFVDNLGDSLSTAAGDALYAETLYVMLAVPGALVGLGLAFLAALGAADRDRRELALLRARGASRRDLLALAGIESLLLGLLAGAIGTAAALLAVRLVGSAGGIGTGRALATFGICVALGFLGAAGARVGAGLSAFRASVTEGRRSVRRQGKPLWQRLQLDLLALAVAGLVYWLTARSSTRTRTRRCRCPSTCSSRQPSSGSGRRSSSSASAGAHSRGSRDARRAAGRPRGTASCSRLRAAAVRRSTAASSSSASSSPSASSSASSPPPTTSRHASMRSSPSAATSSSPRRPTWRRSGRSSAGSPA